LALTTFTLLSDHGRIPSPVQPSRLVLRTRPFALMSMSDPPVFWSHFNIDPSKKPFLFLHMFQPQRAVSTLLVFLM